MPNLAAIIAVALATLVVLGYLVVIWWLDRYEREPLWLVAAAFAWGGLGGTGFGCALSIIPAAVGFGLFGQTGGSAFAAVAVAPLTEELAKALIFIPLVASHHVDNETDGLIYGAATGLGFACVENLTYFMMAESVTAFWIMIVVRTLFSSLVHCVASAGLGMMIGRMHHSRGTGRKITLIAIGYAFAVFSHATWNGLATLAEHASGAGGVLLLGLDMTLVLLAGIVMFGLTQWSLGREHAIVRHFLEREADAGHVPREHVDVVPFWSRRRRPGWLAPGIPKARYLRIATLLAFRQHQLETARGARRDRYAADVVAFREEIRRLVDDAAR